MTTIKYPTTPWGLKIRPTCYVKVFLVDTFQASDRWTDLDFKNVFASVGAITALCVAYIRAIKKMSSGLTLSIGAAAELNKHRIYPLLLYNNRWKRESMNEDTVKSVNRTEIIL